MHLENYFVQDLSFLYFQAIVGHLILKIFFLDLLENFSLYSPRIKQIKNLNSPHFFQQNFPQHLSILIIKDCCWRLLVDFLKLCSFKVFSKSSIDEIPHLWNLQSYFLLLTALTLILPHPVESSPCACLHNHRMSSFHLRFGLLIQHFIISQARGEKNKQ